ncbi:hypothetical protein GP486_004596 [Trichoglossum hirsutum]|uniref:Protein kinase domain-containing protein n=1 Tax=Trichoglossum hirsutum TaxID=265104 RepID=A0A9P8LAW0_9PEZI|nr:hypothetical protein GP486_004596 [Trichoglossum hirsutum]
MDISISSLSLEVPAPPSGSSSARGLSENSVLECAQSAQGGTGNPPTSQTWQEPIDFIAIVALVLEYDVHHLELESNTGIEPQPWQGKNMYTSFSLGEGASSFLELHAMRQDVDLPDRSLRHGDRVALKRAFVDRFDDDVGITPEQYDFIKRELRIFCHKKLRSHENICQLLFVGWEEYSPAPVLALELAEYGTLKDLLFDTDLRDHGSLATKLVLDVASGLSALHEAGIVHGDVKTGNILVFAHAHRKVVAKLSDFSDSIYLADNGQAWMPVGGTHAWRAPECYGTAQYSLKKTDVYSFGLCALAILAQGIWYESANNTSLGDCFLVRMKELDGKTKNEVQAQVTSWKQDANDMVLRWGLQWADNFTEGHDMAKENALFVVSACLWREPEKRKDMETVTQRLLELLGPAGEQRRFSGLNDLTVSRDTRDDGPGSGSDGPDDESQGRSESNKRMFELRVASISSKGIRNLHFSKSRMLRALEKIASPALSFDFPQVDDILEESANLNYADMLFQIAKGSNPVIPTGTHEKSVLRACEAAAQVAECYSIGFGVAQDFATARKWLAVSARCGKMDHAIYFSIIDDALGHTELFRPEVAMRELWLLATASGGCTETFRILKESRPDLYPIAERIRRRSGGILRNARDPEATVNRIVERLNNQNRHIDHKVPPIGYTLLHFAVALGYDAAVEGILEKGADVNAMDFTSCTPLQLAATCGNGQIVDILLRHGADPCIGSDIFRFTPLHFLSFVEDEFLDSVADTMIRSADQLSVISSKRGSVGLENPTQSLEGTPLQWAARKPNPRLFVKLLDKHLTFSATVVDLDDILVHLAATYQSSMLDVVIPQVSRLRTSGLPLDPSGLDQLLLRCVKDPPGVRHLVVHRGAYEKAKLDTVEVLLKAGADPFRLSTTQSQSRGSILQHIVVGDDLDILKRIVAYAQDRQLDLRASLEDTRHFSGRNAFQRAIYTSSWRVFQYLAQSPYVDLDFRSETGMTALHAAATGDDPRFIDVLLRLGCDPYAHSVDGRTPFQSAIFFKAFNSASRLLQSDACNPERLFAATIESCNPAGFTLFASVLAASVTNYRHTVNFTSIRFLESVGAFTFANNVLNGSTLLDMIALLYPSIRPDYEAFDCALLEYILSQAPPEALNRHDAHGLTPLHWMVMRGNLSAITTLLTHPSSRSQVDVNIKTIEATPTVVDSQIERIGSNAGKTALNLALLRRTRIPDFIKLGGQREMRQWGLRTEAIIDVLKEAGGLLGSASTEADELEVTGVAIAHPGDNIIGSLLAPVLGQRYTAEANSHGGAWPLRLQRGRNPSNEEEDLEDGNSQGSEPTAETVTATNHGIRKDMT